MDETATLAAPKTIEDLVCFLEKRPWVFKLPQDDQGACAQQFTRLSEGRLYFKLLAPRRNDDGTMVSTAFLPLPGAGCAMSRFLRFHFHPDCFDCVLSVPGREEFRISYLYMNGPSPKPTGGSF